MVLNLDNHGDLFIDDIVRKCVFNTISQHELIFNNNDDEFTYTFDTEINGHKITW